MSLRAKTMLLSSLGVGGILMTNAAILFHAREARGRDGLQERAALLAGIQADALSQPMWNLDETQVNAAIDALSRDPDFGQAAIVRPNGTIMTARIAPVLRDDPSLRAVGVQRPITILAHGKLHPLGSLKLSLLTARLQTGLMHEAWQRAIVLAFVLAATQAILFSAFRQLNRPLDLLAGALTRLAAGDRETPIPALDHAGEIGAVARGLHVFRETAFRLAQTESEYRGVFEHAALGIFRTDFEGRIVSANPALLALTGYRDLSSLTAALISNGSDSLFVEPGRRLALRDKRAAEEDFAEEISEIRRADGSAAWIVESARAVRDQSGRLLGHVATVEDITERRRRDSEERLRIRGAVESAADAILIADGYGTPLFVNRAFTETLGYDLAAITAAGGMFHLLQQTESPPASQPENDAQIRRMDAELRTASGGMVPMAVRVSAIRGDMGDLALGSVAICTDLSDRRRAEARILHMAHHDTITGLPNRALFQQALAEALNAVRLNGETVAILCIDLDRFKEVNDTLGHAAGDALLQAVAIRLRGAARDTDTVARIGGDEFVVIQRRANQPSGATALAHRLVSELAAPYMIGGLEAVIGASIGIALAPQDSAEADVLLRFADLALYDAKAAGRGVARRFQPALDHLLQSRTAVERDLRRAIADDSIELHYQPQYHLPTGRMVGAEALARWTHPERGPVSPAEFIPVAEQTGLILPIGAWALRTACQEAATWPHRLRVAVNLSPVQFRNGTELVKQIRLTLAETGLDPERLELEITEGILLRDTDATLKTLGALKSLGCTIALDDFGTGYSSLSYLRRMPIDKIKIDQSFVRALGQEPSAMALVRSIIAIAHGLGLTATAEGIETEEQAERLREEGCHQGQGWFFGRPSTASIFRSRLPVGRLVGKTRSSRA